MDSTLYLHGQTKAVSKNYPLLLRTFSIIRLIVECGHEATMGDYTRTFIVIKRS